MIPQYKTILYATDLSENAREVFQNAVSIAQHFGAKIHFLHVVPVMDKSHRNYLAALIGEDKFHKQEEKLNAEIQKNIHERLNTFAKTELGNHAESLESVISIEVLHGHPVEQILKVCERIDADLMVLGSHGKNVLTQTFLGSVVNKVLRRVNRPVMVVPVAE